MTILRIFVCYESTDAAFATQLTTDLRHAGAEVITDRAEAVGIVQGSNLTSTDLDATTLEEFLSKELPRCEYLIVVQTPAALQSPHVRAVVDSALKLVQTGQMIGVLRVIAPTLDAVEPQAVPLRWTKTPGFDASRDYPRVLPRLCLHLGIDASDVNAPTQPGSSIVSPGLVGQQDTRDKPSATLLFPPQRTAAEDRSLRPLRYPRIELLQRLFLLSILIMVLLIIAGVIAFGHPGKSTQTVNIHTPTPVPTSTPTPVPTSTPTLTPDNGVRVNVFYSGADAKRTLHMAYQSNTGLWHDYNLGQSTQGSPSAVEATMSSPTNVAGTVRVYYTDAEDGNLYELYWDPSNGSRGVDNTGRSATGSPSAVIDHNGVIRVFYSDRGTNPASLEEYFLDDTGWHVNDFDHRYQISGDPHAIVKHNGEIDVVYSAADANKTLHIAYQSTTGTWNDYNSGQSTQGNPSVIEATMSSSTNVAGTVRVYYTDAKDGNLHELYWIPSNGWGVDNTELSATGGPSAVIDHNGVIRVFYSDRGTNPASLEEYFLNDTGWHVNDFNHRYQISGDPHAIVKHNGEIDVVYSAADANKTLHMAYESTTGTWNDSNSGQSTRGNPTALEATISSP